MKNLDPRLNFPPALELCLAHQMEQDGRKRHHNFSRITTHIFVGDICAASDGELLRLHGIAGVLSAVAGDADEYAKVGEAAKSTGAVHKVLGLEDSYTDSLAPHLDTTLKFLSAHKPSLVHCIAGASRSTALIVAYLLMADSGRKLENALDEVRAAHAITEPAPWFIAELRVIEKGGRLVRGVDSCQEDFDAPLWLRAKATNESCQFGRTLDFSSRCGCARLRCRKCRAELTPSCAVFGRCGNLFLLTRWVAWLELGERCQCVRCGAKLGMVSKATWIDGVVGCVGNVTPYTIAMSKVDWPIGVDVPKETTAFELL